AALMEANGFQVLKSLILVLKNGRWRKKTMHHGRGNFGAAVVKDSICVIGGNSNDDYPAMSDAVENYKEGKEWKEVYTSPYLRRVQMAAIACSHQY
ncbi:hypothetical protein L195_g043752, partial [Trifolium pratense]